MFKEYKLLGNFVVLTVSEDNWALGIYADRFKLMLFNMAPSYISTFYHVSKFQKIVSKCTLYKIPVLGWAIYTMYDRPLRFSK